MDAQARSCTPVQEPANWVEQHGGLSGPVATDGTAEHGEDARLRQAAWGLWAPLGEGVSLGGALPGDVQTVPRAELWAALQAVRFAIAPVLLLIDNEIVFEGVARVSADPHSFALNLHSEMVDLWRELRDELVSKPPHFCSALWVPSHAMEVLRDPELEEKRLEKLRRARSQHGWQERWLLYNDRADAAAARARDRHPVPAACVNRLKAVDGVARRVLHASVAALEGAFAAAPVGRRRRVD